MRLLLDTHVLLWALSEPDRLSREAARAIRDPESEVFVSAATGWEIAIKQSLGKLDLPGPAAEWLPEALERTGIQEMPIRLADTLRTAALPWHHRDPFDRLLVAQAGGGLVFVTRDERMRSYDVAILWA